MKLTELCNKLRKINKEIAELSEYTSLDLYHNHMYKEFFMAECISKYDPSYHSFAVNGGKSPVGHDFKNSRTENGEIKTSSNCKPKKTGNHKFLISGCDFEFDKQDDKARRKKILSVQSYVFGFFNKKNLIFAQYINGPLGVLWMNDLIRKKQLDKLAIINSCKEKNIQIPRDSIKFTGIELLNCPDSVYLDSDGKVIPNIMDIIQVGKEK